MTIRRVSQSFQLVVKVCYLQGTRLGNYLVLTDVLCVSNSLLQTRLYLVKPGYSASGTRDRELFLISRVTIICILSHLHISSSQIFVLRPFFVYGVIPYRRVVFPCSQVVLPQHSGYRDVTVPPQIRCGVRFVFVVIFFCCSVCTWNLCTICTWNPWILYLHSRKDYTSASFVIHFMHYLAITCQSRYFRVSFVFFGRFCRRLTL